MHQTLSVAITATRFGIQTPVEPEQSRSRMHQKTKPGFQVMHRDKKELPQLSVLCLQKNWSSDICEAYKPYTLARKPSPQDRDSARSSYVPSFLTQQHTSHRNAA